MTANAIARGVTGNVKPFGIVGVGVYPVTTSGTIDLFGVQTDVSDTSTQLGFNLGGGVNFQPTPGPVGFGFEGRWHSIQTEGEALNLVTVTGGINFR
jgi:opacity protein-like surface antigen